MFKFWSILLLSLSSFAAHAADIIAISSGSSTANGSYVADTDYSGGAAFNTTSAINTSNVVSPAPQGVYQNSRYGTSFTYAIPGMTPGTVYQVRLHFAESYFGTPGSRVFNVAINGNPVLTNFDIVAAAGGENIAIVEQFSVAADNTGTISFAFAGVVNNAQVNGIEIVNPGSAPIPGPAPIYNMSLSSDKALYAVGGTATVLVTLSGAPQDPDYDFYVSATFAGQPISLTSVGDGMSYAITPALVSGSNLFIASLYLENKADATALKNAIAYYQSDINRLNAQLAITTDPNAVAAIKAAIARDQDRQAAAQARLSGIRKLIGNPVSLTLTAH